MNVNNPATEPVIPAEDIAKGKTIAILAYCTLIGFIIAIIMHQSEKTKYGAFHIRQALGLFIFGVGGVLVLMAIGMVLWFLWFLLPIVQITLLVFVILGIINAANGKAKGLPLIGAVSEKMLAGIQ
jgi:uncharacterized membrane protein